MTLEQLSNLSDEELNRLAAERVMEWVLREEIWQDYPYKGELLRDWVDQNGKCQSAVADWSPALDRNQSRDLLAAMVGRGAEFSVEFGPEPQVMRRDKHGFWHEIPGNSPRSETIAALLAAFAMEDKNND